MSEIVVKTGLWLACGMIACIYFIIENKKENGYSTISIIEIIIVACGPISFGFMLLNLLTKINIRM